tara:strand:+ start:1385 stop:2356 length:972 start_codon:yes stop_codon:yes gene_type:complete
MGPLELNNLRQEELDARKNAQTNTEVQQVDPSIVLDNIPESLKPKGAAKLGQKILNLGKQAIKIILPKLTSLVKEYAIGEFQTAKNEATTPEQIEDLKTQFCPTLTELQNLINTRNNIVGQLNNVGNKLDTLNLSLQGIQGLTSTFTNLISLTEVTKLSISAVAKALPPGTVPGVVSSALNDLETIDDKVLPKLEKNSAIFNTTTIPTAVVSNILNKLVTLLGQLDGLILLCSPSTKLDPVSKIIQTTANRQTEVNNSPGEYKGFIFQIETVPYTPTVNRYRAQALNQSGIVLLETELSFTTNTNTLINELKLLIDRDNLKSY